MAVCEVNSVVVLVGGGKVAGLSILLRWPSAIAATMLPIAITKEITTIKMPYNPLRDSFTIPSLQMCQRFEE